MCSYGSEAGHGVGTHARQDGSAYVRTAVPVNGNEGAYGVTIDRAAFALQKHGTLFMTEEATGLTSFGEESSTRVP